MSKVPVILQVLPALGIGGIEQGTIDIAEAIVCGGGRALVASAEGVLLPRLRYVGGEHRSLSLPKTVSPFSFWKKVRILRGILRREKVDLVHARSRLPAWVAVVACRLEGVALVTTWHGVHSAKLWPKKYYNSGLLKGERIIAVSSHIAQRLQKEYHVNESRIVTIARGSDPTRFGSECVNGIRIQTLIDRWNIPDDTLVILMPGRLTRWKGQALLIDALGRMVAHPHYRTSPWVCVLVGPETDLSFSQYIYKRASKWGISDRIRFVGSCHDMPAAYALSSMVVVPSLRPEPFGRVAVEAQMMGCPIIGAAHGGVSETILPDKTGILFPPNDCDALMKAVFTLLTASDDMKEEMICCAREHVLSRYTKEHMQKETLAVYDDVIKTTLRQCFERKSKIEEKAYE